MKFKMTNLSVFFDFYFTFNFIKSSISWVMLCISLSILFNFGAMSLIFLYSGIGSSIVGEIASTWGLYALVEGGSYLTFYTQCY